MFALGLLLVLLGAILVAAEAHVPSHGVLGAGAVAALAVGVTLLVSAAGSAVLVSVTAGLIVAGAGSASLLVMVRTKPPRRHTSTPLRRPSTLPNPRPHRRRAVPLARSLPMRKA